MADDPGEFAAAGDEQKGLPETPTKEKFSFSKIWSTRDIQTITSFNREAFLRTSLLEFIIFICFVVVVCIVLPVLRSFDIFFFCNAISKTFVKGPLPGVSYHLTFETIATHEEFYDFLEGPLLNGLYADDNETSWVLFQNRLIGYPQMRQVRVRNNTCPIPRNIQSKISVCHGPYSVDNVSEDPVRGTYGTIYSDKSKVSTIDYTGTLATYKAPGHYLRLKDDRMSSEAILKDLRKSLWIDRGTRAIFVDFFLYNPSTNVICTVTLVGEFSMTGGVFTSNQIRSMRLLNYNIATPGFSIIFVLIIFIVYYCVEEVLEILILRGDYFGLFSSYLDLGILLSGMNIILAVLFCSARTSSLREDIWENPNYPSNLLFMSQVQYNIDIALAFLVFFTFLKLFKYLSINKTLTKLSFTIYESTRDLLGYSILFFFVIISFGLLGMLLFGYQVSIFSTLSFSIVALFRMLLGDIDFEYIDDKHSVIGAAYLIIYVVTIYFILMNVFLAIIFESYSKVKDWIEKKAFEIYLLDYIASKFSKKSDSSKRKKCSAWVDDMLNQGYPEKAVEYVITSHRRQGLKLDSWLNRHQIMTLTFELEEHAITYFNYEKIGLMEKRFDELQEKLEDGINALVKKQNEHRVAMMKLLDMITEAGGSGDEKANNMIKLIQNELMNG